MTNNEQAPSMSDFITQMQEVVEIQAIANGKLEECLKLLGLSHDE